MGTPLLTEMELGSIPRAGANLGGDMKVVLLLGDNDEYLSYKKFTSDIEVDEFLEAIEPLIMANINRQMTLRERLKLLPKGVGYFVYAGKVTGFEVLDLDEE